MKNKDKNLWDYHQTDNRNHLKAGYPRQDMIFNKIKRYLKKGSKTLEIGFGDGYLLNKLSKNGYNVYGQDLSKKNIETTKQQWNNSNINFILGDDGGKFNFDNNSLDGFIASEVLEHMNDNQLDIAISEIYRILKKGGYAFITFPAKENLKNSECICPNCSEVFHKWGHKQYWNEEKIIKKFNNFNIIVLKEFFNRHTSNNYLEFIIGYIMFILRSFLNKFLNLENKSYLLILKKL